MIRFLLAVLSTLACLACGGDESSTDVARQPAPEPAPQTRPAEPGSAPPPAPGPGKVVARAQLVSQVRGIEVANEYTRKFYASELKELYSKFSDEMKTVLPLERLATRQAEFSTQFGPESKVVHEESKMDGGYRAFVRWARFEKYDGVIGVQWILREDDTIAGFFIRPAQPTVAEAPRTKEEEP